MSWLLFARLSSVHVKVSAHNDFMMVMRGNQSGELPASAWAPVAQPLTYQGDLCPVSGSPRQLPVACLMLGSQPECNQCARLARPPNLWHVRPWALAQPVACTPGIWPAQCLRTLESVGLLRQVARRQPCVGVSCDASIARCTEPKSESAWLPQRR